MNSEDIVRELQSIDPKEDRYNDLFSQLYSMHIGLIRAIVNGKAIKDPEDLVQSIWLKVFINLKSFKFKSLFKTWLVSITINECSTALKKQIMEQEWLTYLGDIDLDEEYDTDNRSTRDVRTSVYTRTTPALKVDAETAIDQLSDIEKTTVDLMIEGLNHKEMADRLGISKAAAKARIYRTRKSLTNKML